MPNGISIGSAVFERLQPLPTDTDHATQSITKPRSHAMHAMRPNKNLYSIVTLAYIGFKISVKSPRIQNAHDSE